MNTFVNLCNCCDLKGGEENKGGTGVGTSTIDGCPCEAGGGLRMQKQEAEDVLEYSSQLVHNALALSQIG